MTARNECDRVIVNWIGHEAPCRKLYKKKELNLKPDENSMDFYDNLWGSNMKTLMEHSIEENGEHQKFGCLPDFHSNSPCQLCVLTSESFSERMISVANILVDANLIRLDHDNINKIFHT